MAQKKNPRFVALGKLGGRKGGPARAKSLTADERRRSATKAGKASGAARMTSLTPEQHKKIAKTAAAARWGKKK